MFCSGSIVERGVRLLFKCLCLFPGVFKDFVNGCVRGSFCSYRWFSGVHFGTNVHARVLDIVSSDLRIALLDRVGYPFIVGLL